MQESHVTQHILCTNQKCPKVNEWSVTAQLAVTDHSQTQSPVPFSLSLKMKTRAGVRQEKINFQLKELGYVDTDDRIHVERGGIPEGRSDWHMIRTRFWSPGSYPRPHLPNHRQRSERPQPPPLRTTTTTTNGASLTRDRTRPWS